MEPAPGPSIKDLRAQAAVSQERSSARRSSVHPWPARRDLLVVAFVAILIIGSLLVLRGVLA